MTAPKTDYSIPEIDGDWWPVAGNNEGNNEHTRDPMILKVDEKFLCYYTAHSMRSP